MKFTILKQQKLEYILIQFTFHHVKKLGSMYFMEIKKRENHFINHVEKDVDGKSKPTRDPEYLFR